MAQKKTISCSELYKLLCGYRHEGGLYDDVQEMLEEKGWVYDINLDSWVKPDGR